MENNIKNHEEDSLLRIRYRTYQKCKKQIIIGLVLIGIGFILKNISTISFLVTFIGTILSISSFFGILSNKLSKKQIESIKNNQHIDSKT